jgi:hypothetical protein
VKVALGALWLVWKPRSILYHLLLPVSEPQKEEETEAP